MTKNNGGLPKSRRLWVYELQLPTEGGEMKWFKSDLLPHQAATTEAQKWRDQGHTVRVAEDQRAVAEYMKEQERERELQKALRK